MKQIHLAETKVLCASSIELITPMARFRAETCCIVGNYYTLKASQWLLVPVFVLLMSRSCIKVFGLQGCHEKAVVYFERALKLNRNYLAAWTLMVYIATSHSTSSSCPCLGLSVAALYGVQVCYT